MVRLQKSFPLSSRFVWHKNIFFIFAQLKKKYPLTHGVKANTSGFGPEESRFESWWASAISCLIFRAAYFV